MAARWQGFQWRLLLFQQYGCRYAEASPREEHSQSFDKGMEHQRCLWRGWKDAGYMLWAERMSKDERDTIAGQKEGYMGYQSQFHNPGLCEASVTLAKP
jgi:hypothetical protein